MDKNKLMEQLRKAVREVIKEELGKSSYDAKSGISTTALTKDGKSVGYIKHKQTDKGLVAGGRIGPKAAKAVTAEEKITTNIPVAALPSYKKGQQPTVMNPQTGEEEIESDVSSWAKKADENKYSLPAGSTGKGKGKRPLTAFEKRFKDVQPGESVPLKGDPKKVTPAPKQSMEDKARAMGQMDMFTLEEWIGMLEEAGYAIREPEPHRGQPGSFDYKQAGYDVGDRGEPVVQPPKNKEDSMEWEDLPLEERNKENKAKKDAVISRAGRSARIDAMAKARRAGNPFAGIGVKNLDSPDHESHSKIYNKKVGRRDTKFSPTEERNKENKKRRTPLLQDPEEY